MSGQHPAMPYLVQLCPDNGWRPEVIPDRDGPRAITAVRVGARFTDAVAIEELLDLPDPDGDSR